MISEDSNVEVVRAALRDEVGGDWRITVQTPDAPAEVGLARPAGSSPPSVIAERDPRDDTDFEALPPTSADPETDALDLLQARLGARPIDS
jgi:hypothetical protein